MIIENLPSEELKAIRKLRKDFSIDYERILKVRANALCKFDITCCSLIPQHFDLTLFISS